MLTDETRNEADRAREMFQKRLAAAQGTRPAPEIEWDAFAKALPEVDVAGTRASYAKAAAALPRVTYDAAADVAAHTTKEAAWTGFASYCAARVTELDALAAEQSKHRLHQWYRRRQLFSRCVGGAGGKGLCPCARLFVCACCSFCPLVWAPVESALLPCAPDA